MLKLQGSPASTFGIVSLDCAEPDVGDDCYIIHHAGGGHKAYDSGEFIPFVDPGGECGSDHFPDQVSYELLKRGGASGSPVFSAVTNGVQALNHCGSQDEPCVDSSIGVPMSVIVPEILSEIEEEGCSVNLITCCGPPTMTVPDDQTQCAGEPATFCVTTTGAETHRWQRNGVDIPGATGTCYTIPSVQNGNEGDYRCVACNDCGCTTTSAAELTVITNSECQDGVFCNGGESCSNGQCMAGIPIPGCCKVDGDCSDANVCDGNETCINHTCSPGQPLDCSDGNPCTDDLCSPVGGCFHSNNSLACDDGDVCTTPDLCSGGECVGGPPGACEGEGCTDCNNTGIRDDCELLVDCDGNSVPDACEPAGDGNEDCHVDLHDMALLQRCYSGAAEALPQCFAFDVDHNQKVDLVDWAMIYGSLTGP